MSDGRTPLSFKSATRDSLRTRGPWQVNTFIDGVQTRKRFGFTLDTARSSSGQGLFFYSTTKVSIAGDTIYIGEDSFAL